jgi:biopolymer transport protein ExbD
MKQYLSKFLFGCVGICVGFSFCYFSFVEPQAESNPPVVTVASDGTVYLGGAKTDLSQLTLSLKKQAALRQTITILLDAHIDFKEANAVLDACKASGPTKFAARITGLR